MPDTLDLMMQFEAGELDDAGIDHLFQRLINSGLAWKLQGFYGRTAMLLIDAGRCTMPK